MRTIIHQWDFETASRFLQSLAKQGAWRALRNLKMAGIDMRARNGAGDAVQVEIRLPVK